MVAQLPLEDAAAEEEERPGESQPMDQCAGSRAVNFELVRGRVPDIVPASNTEESKSYTYTIDDSIRFDSDSSFPAMQRPSTFSREHHVHAENIDRLCTGSGST